jgi:short-subunit dehydrogenase
MKTDHYALVTGASRGIGECFAGALAARSWNLVLVARTNDRLKQVGAELADRFGVRTESICIDLAEEGAAAEVARVAMERELDVELLVNNAASGDHGEFSKMSAESQSRVICLNTLALVDLTRRMLPPMIDARRGVIINVSSTAGFQPMPYFAVYAASKAFVTSFSMALAEEVRGDGIRVVTLCPGPTRAPSHEDLVSKSRIALSRQPAEEVVEAALSQAEGKGGLVVPRMINKAMTFSNRLMPLSLSAKISGRAMRPRDS